MFLKSKKQQSSAVSRRRGKIATRSPQGEGTNALRNYTFRRNRTITGSLSSEVAAADIESSRFKSPRTHAHDLRKYRKLLVGVFLVVTFGLVMISILLFQFIARPQAVAANGASIQHTVYEEIIQGYFGMYPGQRFRFSVDTVQLTQYLQEHGAPEVLKVDERMTFQELGLSQFILIFREPAVMWRTGDEILYVDRSGMSFRRNYYPRPTVEVVDNSGIRARGNQVLASNRFLGFIGQVVGAMADNGFSVAQVEIPAGVTRQVDIRLTGVGYPIKLSVDRPAGEQSQDAARAVTHLASKGIDPGYIDVRVSGRAYYK